MSHVAEIERDTDPAEQGRPWLTILLDALAILDRGLHDELAVAQRTRDDAIGCHAGCAACCQSGLRLRAIEIEGIAWYAAERMERETWRRVREQLSGPDTGVCPFLVDGLCSVRPLRPITCRRFFVFGRPCRVGEPIFQTRRADIFRHSGALTERVAMRLFDDDSFGLPTERDKRHALRNGLWLRSTVALLSVDWIATIETLRDAPTGQR